MESVKNAQGGNNMSVKIRISYNTEEEPAGVIRLLFSLRNSSGRAKKACKKFVDTVTRAQKPDKT